MRISLTVENISEPMDNILHFISSVQDSCDKHRVCLERKWYEEYMKYLSEWKAKQNEIKKQAEIKKVDEHAHKEKIAKELEELALADALLKRARSIRNKNEKLINGIVDIMNVPISDCPVLNSKSTSLSNTSEKYKTSRRIPQSKSDFIASAHKTPVVPRSKSASVAIVPNNDLKFCRKYSISSRSVSANHTRRIDKTTESITAISSNELNMLKELHVNLQSCTEIQQKQKNLFSDSSGDIHQQQPLMQPTPIEYLRIMRRKLEHADSLHLNFKLWYPFINSRSKGFLTVSKSHNICSFQRICNAIHSIQEVMMWIDLLHLLDRDVFPSMLYNEKDVNVLRFCSYLLSIFQRYSQRIPILNPNG